MRSDGRRSLGDYLLLLKVALGALCGGLSATAVLAFSSGLPRKGLLLFIVLVVVLLAVLTVATLQSGGRDADAPAYPDDGWRAPRPPQYAKQAPYGGRPSGPTSRPPNLQPLPAFPPQYAGGTGQAAGHDLRAGSRPSFTPAPAPQPPPDLRPPSYDTYEVAGARRSTGEPVRRIVQCPRCGGFDVVVQAGHDAFAFGCRSCRHDWAWTPGRPWPAIVVRPTAARPTGHDVGTA